MLSPSELENKKVDAHGRKYFKLEMDEYLELVFDNYKNLYAENEELKKQVKTLTDGIQYYRSIESTMQKALVLAEKTSKETKDAAVLKAEAIEKEARGKANRIVSEAESEYDRIRDKCLDLVSQFNRYKQQLQSAAQEQLRLVTSASFEVDTPDIEGRDVAAAMETPITAADMPGVSEVSSEQSYQEPSPLDIQPMNPDVQVEAPTPIVQETISEEQPDPALNFEPATEDWVASEQAQPVQQTSPEPVPEKTMVLPDVKSVDREALRSKDNWSQEEAQSILSAETINLGDSINAVRQAETTPVLEVPEVKAEPETLEIMPDSAPKAEPQGLDSILNNMTIGKKKDNSLSTDDDPFEFLGSVDDF